VQTFLPEFSGQAFYTTIDKSLQCLDDRRLGKQRVEAFQILCALGDPWALEERKRRGLLKPLGSGWKNHPAVLQWKGKETALGLYMGAAIDEWVKRKFQNTMRKRSVRGEYVGFPDCCPRWFYDKAYHDSHKSNLLRKDPEFYGRYGWDVPSDLPYIWPKGA
jgi:hypothetical protein